MPYVMLDTNVALPATLSPSGRRRKFWVLLTLGALTYEVEHRNLELEELRREAEATSGRLGGMARATSLVRMAEERRTALIERLPIGTPDNWVAAGSGPLFDEYERKLREIGRRLNPRLRRRAIPQLRRQFEAICEYQFGDHRILATTFNYFIAELCADVEWDEIDGAIVADALAAQDPFTVDLDEDTEEDLL